MDDFYDDTNYFDEEVEKLKDSIRSGVKKEITEEIHSLRKQIKILEPVKENWDNIKFELREKIRILEKEKETFKREYLKENLGALIIKYYDTSIYELSSKSENREKCNKCDENRQYEITTPDGISHEINCFCSRPKNIFFVRELQSLRLALNKKNNGEVEAVFLGVKGCYDEIKIYRKEIMNTLEEAVKNNVPSYRAYFVDKSIAEKYCEYLNSKEI